jgi:hypothetical protein
MIYIIDDFIDHNYFDFKLKELLNQDFAEYIVGDKTFYVQLSDSLFDKTVIDLISKKENNKINNILSFFRMSTDVLDTDWRIHSDLNIMGQRPDRAAVLYMTPRVINDLHGTAFWSHRVYGDSLPPHVTDKEFDDMIIKEANEVDQWELQSVIGYKQNRLVSYNANYFHSKYPNKSWVEGRIVYVIFYNINK